MECGTFAAVFQDESSLTPTNDVHDPTVLLPSPLLPPLPPLPPVGIARQTSSYRTSSCTRSDQKHARSPPSSADYATRMTSNESHMSEACDLGDEKCFPGGSSNVAVERLTESVTTGVQPKQKTQPAVNHRERSRIPLFKHKQLQSQIIVVTSKQRAALAGGSSALKIETVDNKPSRVECVKEPKKRRSVKVEDEEDEEEDDEEDEEEDEEEDDEEDTEGSLAEFIEHDSEEEDTDSSYSEQLSHDENKPRSTSNGSLSSEEDHSSSSGCEDSDNSEDSEEDDSRSSEGSKEEVSNNEGSSSPRDFDMSHSKSPTLPASESVSSPNESLETDELAQRPPACTRFSGTESDISVSSALHARKKKMLVACDSIERGDGTEPELHVRTERVNDAQDAKKKKPKRNRHILESEDEQVIIKQYTPQMETEGSIETNGRRVSSRATKGRPPTRYVDENFVEFMLDDVEVDLLLEESESTADN